MGDFLPKSLFTPANYKYDAAVRAEAQALFDKSMLGVLAQGRPSRAVRGCLYRSMEGSLELRCALGHLFSDALLAALDRCRNGLNQAFEGIPDLLHQHGMFDGHRAELLALWPHRPLLVALQAVHDNVAWEGDSQAYRRGVLSAALEVAGQGLLSADKLRRSQPQ